MPLSCRLHWRIPLMLAGLLALATVYLVPALKTGYWAEDLCQSLVPRAQMVLDGASFGKVVVDAIRHTLLSGRFFPLSAALMPTAHYLCGDAWHYKAYILAGNLVDLLLFVGLVAQLTRRAGFAVFAGLVALGLIQFRVTLDPSLGFYGQMQILLASLLLCLISTQRWLERRSQSPGRGTGWLFAAVSFYLICCLLYEVSYTLVLLPLALIQRATGHWRRSMRLALPFLVVVGVCGLQSFLIRWLHPSDQYWHQTNIEPRRVLATLAGQISAGLPLSFFLCDPQDLYHVRGIPGFAQWLLTGPSSLLVLGSFALCLLSLPKRNASSESATQLPAPLALEGRWVLGLGTVLAVCPALMLSISPYHQTLIAPGVGWIPVLLQGYGVAWMLATGLWSMLQWPWLGGSAATWKRVGVALTVGVLVGWTYRANEEVVRCFTATPGSTRFRGAVADAGGGHHYQRELLELALQAGLLDEVPPGAVVAMTREYPFWYDATFSRYFFATHAGKPITPLAPSTAAAPPTERVYQLRESLSYREFGYVVLAERLPGGTGTTTGRRLFVRFPDRGDRDREPGFQVWTTGDLPQPIDPTALPLVRSGPGWVLYELEPRTVPAPGEAIEVVFAHQKPSAALARSAPDPGRTIPDRVRR